MAGRSVGNRLQTDRHGYLPPRANVLCADDLMQSANISPKRNKCFARHHWRYQMQLNASCLLGPGADWGAGSMGPVVGYGAQEVGRNR